MSSVSDQLRILEERLARRQVADRGELESLFAEEFREHGVSGRMYGRAEALEWYELGRTTQLEITDFEVEMLADDVALATYCSWASNGRRAWRSSLWVREGERWRMRFHQGTVIPDVS